MKLINLNELFRSENEKLQHNIPLGSLVEIDGSGSAEKYHGLRLFVVSHDRDCDGTPLYGMSFNKKVKGELDNLTNHVKETSDPHDKRAYQYFMAVTEGEILNGFAEESLTIITQGEPE